MTVEWAEPITSTSGLSDWFPSCFNATLYVPYGTKAAYEASEWVNFKEIIEYGKGQNATNYIINAGFDDDLTFQVDGTMKEAIKTTYSLSDRSWAYECADSTVYARPKSTSGQSRPDGRKLEAVNGFKGRVQGWTLETNGEYPKCEWTYFGTVPYALEDKAVCISDNSNIYMTVPERPTEFDGGEGFLYLRAGWTNHAVYKQKVNLPAARYRLEYWTINLNPEATAVAKDLTQVTCGEEVYKDKSEVGVMNTVWTKHELEFTSMGEIVLQIGFRAANNTSNSNPIVCFDGLNILKIGEATNRYTLEILGHFNPDESHLYDRDGNEYDVTDFSNNEFDEGSYIRIEPFVYPGSYYIREILVNGESVGVWTDENTAPTEYVIESLSCNTTVEFKTYYNTRIRTLSCRVEGSGNVKMYKNNVLVGTTTDQGEPRYCSAVFDEGDVLKLEFIPNAGSNLTKLLGGDLGDVESMVELTEEITDNIYTISFPSGYHGDYPLLRCFYASFEKETQDYSLTVDPGNYCTVEHLYVKKGDEVIETIDGGNSCSVEEGCSVGIELSVPAGLYIREIIVNDVTVATYTDEDVANGNNPDGYLLENISENTIVKFKTYPNVLHRNVGCTASGPGKVEMYRNGNYVGTTTSQDGGYPYLTCEALDEGEVLKLVFVSDEGGSFTKLMAGEHDGYEDTDFTGKVVDNTLTITMDFDNEDVLQYRSFIAYFEGPTPSTNNALSASVPTLLTGKTSTMSLSLTNEDVIIACEFDLLLPNGITLAKDEDGDVIRTLGSRASKHVLEVSDRGNGVYHFLCFSNTNKVFTGNEGELLSVEFVCDESMSEGTYEATVKNIILSDPDLKKLTLADYKFGVEVINADPGDVNNDGDINVMDVVQTVAYIMGNGTADFIFGAADMDNDGSINVVDLVRIVSMIMSSSTTAPAQPWTDNSLLLNTCADGTIAVGVNTDIPYVASEFIVEVGSGQSLEDVTTDKQHRATFVPVDDTHYKVMTYSSSNQQFADTDAMLTLHVSGEGLVTVRDAILVDEDYKGVTFAPTSGGYTTGIMQMENGKLIIENSSVYDLQGRKHDTLQSFKHEVLIVNGKKQVVK